jgi:hypothetical protein
MQVIGIYIWNQFDICMYYLCIHLFKTNNILLN